MARRSKSSTGGPGFGEERQSPIEATSLQAGSRETTSTRRERRLLKLGPDGRVLIPADWRQAMELKDPDTLVAYLEDGVLTLHGSAVGARRAQTLAKKLLAPGPSLVDELITDRREEARRETQDE